MPSAQELHVIDVKYYVNYSPGGQGESQCFAPWTRVGYHFVIHESSYFPQRSKFSMTIIWGFNNSTWKQPKPIAYSFYT